MGGQVAQPGLSQPRLTAPMLCAAEGFGGGEEPGGEDLMLDLYPNAAFAYSQQKLRSDYMGALVRVRRSSDNGEEDFFDDGAGGLQNSTGTGIETWVGAGNDGFVSTRYDQSGNGRDESQSTASNQPRIVNAGTLEKSNGHPSIRFIAANSTDLVTAELSTTFLDKDSLLVCYFEMLDAASVQGVFTEQGQPPDPAGARVVLYADTRDTNFRLATYAPNGGNLPIDYSSQQDPSVRLVSLSRSGTLSGGYHNSTFVDSVDSTESFGEPTKFHTGVQPAGGLYFNGYVTETILWPTDRSADRADIEAAINARYAIY